MSKETPSLNSIGWVSFVDVNLSWGLFDGLDCDSCISLGFLGLSTFGLILDA